MDWGSFHALSVVVHYLPSEKDEPRGELVLTDAAIALDGQLKQYFEGKISSRLERNGLEVVADEEGDATIRESVAEVLKDPDALVSASKSIAERLFEIQNKTNSSGLLGVVHGATEDGTSLGIVKMERERGIHFEIDKVDGKNIVTLELLRRLTLTDKTKVYKTALLTCPLNDPLALSGYVADDQRTSRVGSQVASFFLGQFLGCKPRIPSAEMTYKFVKAANDAINHDVVSPEKRGQYQIALIAVLQDGSTDIRPSGFAGRYLDAEHRDSFLERVAKSGLDPDVSFQKDTSRVNASEFSVTFESGMILVGNSQALEDHVSLPDENGSMTTIDDDIKAVFTGR